MNKLWVFVGGCVAGALGVLAAAAVADEGTRVVTNTEEEGDERSVKEQEEERQEGEAVSVLE